MSTLGPAPAGRTGGAGVGLADRRRRQRGGRARRPARARRPGRGLLARARSNARCRAARRYWAPAAGRPASPRGQGDPARASACRCGGARCPSSRDWRDRGGYGCSGTRPPPAKHGRKILAGAGMRLVQEGALLAIWPLPVAHEVDVAPVGEGEAGDIDGVAEGVLRELGARHIVDRPAAIGAEDFDGCDLLSEARFGVGLDDVLEPGLERRDHRAVDRQNLVERDGPVGDRGDLERTRHAANARSIDRGRGDVWSRRA